MNAENVKQQAFYNTFGNIVYLFSLWVIQVIVTRALGYEAVGCFTLAMSVGNVFLAIQLYGMRSYQVSDVSGEFCPSAYRGSRAVTCAVGLLLCVAYLTFTRYSLEKNLVVFLFLLYRTAEAVSDVYFGDLQKIARLDILAISMSSKGVLSVFLFTVSIFLTKSLWFSMLLMALSASAISLLYDRRQYMKLIPHVGEKETDDRNRWLLLKLCFPLMIATLIPIFVTSFPRVLLERYHGEALLGYYGNLSAPTVLIITVVPYVLIPIMTLYGKMLQENRQREVLRLFGFSLVGTCLFGGVCCLGVFLLGKPVMSLLFTEQIVPYIHFMYPLIGVIVIYAMTMCCNSVLITVRKNRFVAKTALVSMVACTVCSLLSIRDMGIDGVILTMGIAYASQFLLQLVYIAWLFSGRRLQSQ